MKIGIIGSGNMGRTLGLLWSGKGHDVFFGSRNEYDVKYIQRISTKQIKYSPIKEAVIFGDILFYSLRDVLPSSLADKQTWTGKIIIDCNNGEIPGDFNYPPITESYTEEFQRDVPHAKVVKAFNTIAQELYFHDFATIQKSGAAGFMAGDDSEAKEIVAQLIREIGLTPIDVGLSYNAKQLESFADMVRLLMIRNNMGPFLTFTATILPPKEPGILGERQSTKYR